MHLQTHKTKSKSKPQQSVKLLAIEIAVLVLALQREKAILKFNCLADAADVGQGPKRGKKGGRVGKGESKWGSVGKQMNGTSIKGKNSQ